VEAVRAVRVEDLVGLHILTGIARAEPICTKGAFVSAVRPVKVAATDDIAAGNGTLTSFGATQPSRIDKRTGGEEEEGEQEREEEEEAQEEERNED